MFKKLLQNCRKPEGFGGKLILNSMNYGHAAISQWGLSHMKAKKDARVLDVGCGGGANIKRLLTMCPQGHIDGIDYSEESVAASRKKNASELGKRCNIQQGSVSKLPYEDGSFHVVTAFETIYFWPDIVKDFKEIKRVLKPGGSFLICNESDDPSDKTWTDKIKGMRVYSSSELTRLLSDNGFTVTVNDTNKNHWLCIIAERM